MSEFQFSQLPIGWHSKSLAEVALPINERGSENAWPYIEIGDIDTDSKDYVFKGKKSIAGCKKAHQGNILISRVRPTRGAVSIVREDSIAVSNAFTILSPRDVTELSNEYLFYVLAFNSEFFLRLGARQRGSSYPSCRESDILDFKIPVPPMPIQLSLVRILKRARLLRQRRRQANQLTNKIIQSVFLKMFGDPDSNPMGWEEAELGELVQELRYGTSVKCTSQRNGRIPVLRIPNILHGSIDLGNLKFANLTESELVRFGLQDGDLLFVRTNGNREFVGRCAVFHGMDEPYAFASYLIRARLRTNRLRPDFAKVLLVFPALRNQLFARARTSAGQYNINTEGLRSIMLMLPPGEAQDRFVSMLNTLSKLERRQRESTDEINELFHSLMHKAFRGELVA